MNVIWFIIEIIEIWICIFWKVILFIWFEVCKFVVNKDWYVCRGIIVY